MITRSVFVLCAAAIAVSAQSNTSEWEFGGNIGYGAYRNGTIFAPGGTATAGIRNRFTAGAVVCDDLYEHISGELRYQYQDGHPFLSSGGTAKDIQGQSHTFTYELLFHIKPRDARMRPFVAVGAGIKNYNIVGPAPDPQPFPSIGTLNNTGEWKLAAALGGGVKYRLYEHLLVRVDFRDYITQFPKRQLAPAAAGTARGLFQQFTTMLGVSYVF